MPDLQHEARGLAGWLESMLACPLCHGSMLRDAFAYSCARCSREYPIRFGIPDFRLAPDPYISVEAEIQKIDMLFKGPPKSFVELLAAYYKLSPENPRSLNTHYVAAMEASVRRGAGILRRLIDAFPSVPRKTLLDLGCGTGGMIASSGAYFERSVGVDVALRWMLIGRQRLRELGIEVPLICANAESLPFADDSFDAVAADAVVEHVRNPLLMRDETLRVLNQNGAFFYTTNNRFSILPEPHLRIAGFGLLPRRLMERAAMWLRKTPYRARLMSLRELNAVFGRISQISLPSYREGELGSSHENLRRRWERLSRHAVVRALVWPFAPQYFIYGSKNSRTNGTVATPRP
ncbi:MAG: methyltransferase domain-containing protein [Gemmatimonadales bacterium]